MASWAMTWAGVAPSSASNWNGPYLKKESGLIDPWGTRYIYRIPGKHGDEDVYSLGSDHAEGGEGEAKDVRISWIWRHRGNGFAKRSVWWLDALEVTGI